MTTATPPQVDRAEIRRELDRFVLRSVQPMGLRVLSVDDAVAVATARELASLANRNPNAVHDLMWL